MIQNKQLEQLLHGLFGPDANSYIESLLQPKRPGIRLNLLKAEEREILSLLQESGFRLSPLGFVEAGYRVDYYPVEIGRTPEHLLGLIYVQNPGSMLPAALLRPEPGQRVLDVAAAPGSKTTQLCTMMRNTGLIVANDPDRSRLKALNGNIDRWGCINTGTISLDGGKLGRVYPNFFDRVLLDAPCSGLGTLHKNPGITSWWSFEKVRSFTALQRRLILSSYDALASGGIMVYSTCTITPQENEEVVNHLLQQRPDAQLLPISLPGVQLEPGFGPDGFSKLHPDLVKTARLYPWRNPGAEAFYLALIRKPHISS